MNTNGKRGRPANVTQEQVMNTYWELHKEKVSGAEPGEVVTVTAGEVHKRLGTTASHSTVAKYLSRGLSIASEKETSDSDISDQVKETFVRAGMQAVEILQEQYQRLQAQTQKHCLDEISVAIRREEVAWSRAEELEKYLAERVLIIESLEVEIQSLKDKLSSAKVEMEGLETLADALAQEKEGWIADIKQALLDK
ncbi:MAG: hypothetical protein ABW168_03320 [Sedimenticola sp.]